MPAGATPVTSHSIFFCGGRRRVIVRRFVHGAAAGFELEPTAAYPTILRR